MIPKGDYLNILPEFNTPYGVGYKELLCFDYIYDVVDHDKTDYPCGIFLNKGDGMSVFASLYDYEPPSNRFSYTNYFWKEDDKYEELTLPLFFITRGGMPMKVKDAPKHLFSDIVHQYKNLSESFKLKEDGFYQVIQNSFKPVDKVFSRSAMIKKHWHERCFNDFKFQEIESLMFYRVHFLDDKIVQNHVKKGDIYDFAENYCFVVNQDKDISYMIDPEFVKYLDDNFDYKIEPFIVDDENIKESVPTMQFHGIFLKSKHDVKKLKKYLTGKRWGCVPFHSTASDDATNQFFLKNHSMLYKNSISRDLCRFVVLDDHRFTQNEYGIGFDRLRSTKSLEEDLKKKNLIWSFYETFMPESHKMVYDHTYATNEKFFRRLKIHNYKDVDYITHVFINKYLLDLKGK